METNGDVALRVLLAEAHRTVAQALTHLVGELGNARVAATTSAAEALEVGAKLHPDVAILDLELSPDCSLVTGLHALCPETRIIVLADKDVDDGERLVKALASGAVGAIYKEASLEEFVRAVGSSSTRSPVVPTEATGVLLDSYIGTLSEKRARDIAMIEALASAVEVRDLCTGQHLHRVTDLAQACLRDVDEDLASNEDIRYGFLLHDVGKIGIPDAILNKPGPLTSAEWNVMKRHPAMGVDIVRPVGLSQKATDVILCHHERWDGGGYPNGLSGEEIPIAARAFAVVDAYDAMTTDRPYRAAMSRGDALQIIHSHAGTRFDPGMVEVVMALPDPRAPQISPPELIDLTE